jgi:hypothetical protein
MRTALPIIAALALTACSTLPAAPPPRTDAHARLGEATRVGTLVVMPRAVIEDSRCPINARCVWAGRLVVQALVRGQGWAETRNLMLGQPAAMHGTTIALTSAEPGKMAGVSPLPAVPMTFGFEGGR